MNIKELNEKLRFFTEGPIEWKEEIICKIDPTINELFIKDVDMYGFLNLNEAVDTMINLYHENKLRVCIPTNTAFKYKEKTYYLHLVMGIAEYKNNQIVCKYGIKHIMDKHSKEQTIVDDNTLCSEDKLTKAIKRVGEALSNGKAFISKEYNDRLVIQYQGFLYVICYSNDDKQLTYLQTMFKPTKEYVKKNLPGKRFEKTDITTMEDQK